MTAKKPPADKRKSATKADRSKHDDKIAAILFSPLDSAEQKKGPSAPVSYSPEIGDRICALLMQGYTLLKICQHPKAPAYATVQKWLRENVDQKFSDQYRLAREFQADLDHDRMCEIERLMAEGKFDVMRGRAIIASISSRIAKMNPAKYSDRFRVDHSGEIGTTAAERNRPDWIGDKLAANDQASKIAPLLAKKKTG